MCTAPLKCARTQGGATCDKSDTAAVGGRWPPGAALTTGLVASLSACAGWGAVGQGGGGDAINVLMVNNPQMVDLQQLTAENFTAKTGIRVNFTVLPENDVRDKISQEFTSQAGQYDVASLSNFEIPIYAKAGWISPLDGFIAKDAAFDQADILEPMQVSLSSEGKVYGEPFYGESSFLMYRKDVLDAKGLTMPANPTWPQVADIAAKVDGAEPGMAGICLRGQPGLGPALRAVDHRRQHLRRHLVREGLDAQGRRLRVQAGDQLLRQPRAQLRRERRPPGRVHRVPQQPDPRQRGDVVRRDVGRRVARGQGLPGPGQDRLRRRARRQDEELGLALRLVVEHPGSEHEAGERLEVRLVGLRQGVRAAGRRQARLVARARRQAGLDIRQPGLPGRGGRVRGPDQGRHRVRRPGQPRRAAAAGTGHPVRRHPRVPRPRHPGQSGRQLRHRGEDHRRRGAGQGPRARRGRRRALPGTGGSSEHRNHDPGGRPAAGRLTAAVDPAREGW